ncbi:4-alpha-glucanotransferase [bacterium]|nr:4-alpha-glucanotransferase [bacterium]
MKTLHFEIPYTTRWGEHLEIIYSIDGSRAETKAMDTADGHWWTTSLQASAGARHLRHVYRVVDDEGRILRAELNHWRDFRFNHRSEVFFADTWADECLPYLYHRTAFSENLMLPRGADNLHLEQLSSACLLLLHALPPGPGKAWGVVGSEPGWGSWNAKKARTLQRTGTYEYTLPLTRSDFERGVTYKYVLIDLLNPDNTVWEDGGDRSLPARPTPGTASVIRQDEMPRVTLQPWKGTGCVIPVFSLRSKNSFGIGDFADLKLFVRWAADTGLQAVQLLPVNDTTRMGTWHDSYPYNSVSVFALHPLYLSPLPWKNTQAYTDCKDEAESLNALPEVDYEKVFALKMRFARNLFKETGAAVLKTPAYKDFCEENAYWLVPYTRFCVSRDLYGTADFRHWPEQAAELPPSALDFYACLQFWLHRQMLEAHEAARSLGVLLKGDIPIGICKDSVPAWQDGRLFHFDGQAGAPPDYFAVMGQNWGFPTYNWDEMAKDGYLWWRRRLAHMEKYFDAYRLDHVLGFFRIWEIPSDQEYGVMGHFRPALPLSKEEIRNFGFTEDVDKFSRPFIPAAAGAEFTSRFGAGQTERYLLPTAGGYTLQPSYLTGRLIKASVPNGPLQDFLMQAATEVLFIRDKENPEKFHPRIAAGITHVFTTLPPDQQQAFNRLHDDFFYNRHNDFWAAEAMKKLPVITQSVDRENESLALYPYRGKGMLPCAEDLGMVPATVPPVLRRLGILTLEIQRMPKTYGIRYARLEDNPYLSVATIATHDMPPLRKWWTMNEEQTQQFWHEALGHEGKAPAEATPEVCEEVVSRHIQSPSMLCLLSLQDLLAISPELRSRHPENEQINDPSNPNQNWNYRMHLTLEQLIQATAFNEKLRGLVNRKD